MAGFNMIKIGYEMASIYEKKKKKIGVESERLE